ncbi:putative galactose oxidase precursor [Fusarium bulbicola]|nr:putative galactose oxidase precursor [Fusarium bulbicola]
MKVIGCDRFFSGHFKIGLQTSFAREVNPIVKTIPRPSPEVGDDEESQAAEADDIKNEDDAPGELLSESGVARSVAEPEVESDPCPVARHELGSVCGWNRLFFGKESPKEEEKKGLRLEIKVRGHILEFFCGRKFLDPAVGSVLEATDYGWDAVALGITVKAIQGQYDYVPVKIDLELFVKIAVIADYMECGEALFMPSRVWLSNLDDHKAVKGLDSTSLMLFYVSWVFSLDELSCPMEEMVTMGYQGPETVELNGLPLQGFVVKLPPPLCLSAFL